MSVRFKSIKIDISVLMLNGNLFSLKIQFYFLVMVFFNKNSDKILLSQNRETVNSLVLELIREIY
jgi:hypothetical protein